MSYKIPLAKPYVGEEEIKALKEVVNSGFLSFGSKLPEFEKRFAEYLGAKYAVAVSSGTAGLHLCVKALGFKKGDEVITTPFSFVASANCLLYEGVTPVFVDIDEKTFNMDDSKIEEKITPKTKAILPVHVFGQPCNMDKIMEIAARHNLAVIEDACEALGSSYSGKKAGLFGNAAVFAFYPNKQMTTGEGGMIVTNDDKIYKMCKILRNQGRQEEDKWLIHHHLGYNYRLDEMSCAVGLEQLKKLDFMLKKRQEIAEKYSKAFSDTEGIKAPFVKAGAEHSWFLYVVLLKEGVDREKVIETLAKQGIQTRPYFPPIHSQPYFKKMFPGQESLPVCEKISRQTLALPFYIQLTDEDINKVASSIKALV